MPTVDYERRAETALERIENSDEIHPDNKKRIREFKRDLTLDDMSDAWISKLLGHLYHIGERLGDTRFEDVETDDMKDLVEWVQGRKKGNGETISDATINAYKQVIKRFWRWLNDLPSGEHPEVTKWVNTTGPSKNGNGTLPTDLLIREDVDALKDACRNDRDRAFIAMLYETGARIGELIDLTVGDIEDHKHGRKVVIDGKTGPRRLPLLESSPALNDWLNDHPSGRVDDPLWCQLQDAESELSYHYIRQKLLPRAGRRAAASDPETFAKNPGAIDESIEELEFYKPLNPHHWRHSRATHLAARDEFNEYKLCEWFGWVTGSDVPQRYVHLSGKDIDDAYGRMHGIVDEDEDELEQTVEECWRCPTLNETSDQFCSGCGAALNIDAAQEIETAEEEVTKDTTPEKLELALKLVDKLDEDPDAVRAFVEGRD